MWKINKMQDRQKLEETFFFRVTKRDTESCPEKNLEVGIRSRVSRV